MRFETIPGEQAQVDWGYFGEFYDSDKKRFIRLCCFVMILGYSRTRFIHFFDGDNTTNFLKGHNLAFEYFGGIFRKNGQGKSSVSRKLRVFIKREDFI